MFNVLKYTLIFIAVLFVSYLFFPEQLKMMIAYISSFVFQNEEFIIDKIEMIKGWFVRLYEVFMNLVNFIKGFFTDN